MKNRQISLPVVGAESGHIAAHAQVRVADHHHAVEHARGSGDGIGLGLVEGLGGPHRLAVVGVQRDQPPVEGGDDDLALPGGQAARHRLAAGIAAPLARDLRIVGPQHLAGARVIGRGHVPGADVVDHAVDEQRRAFDATEGVELRVPGQAELADVLLVDLGQRAVALGRIGASVRHPVAGVGRGVAETRGVNSGGTRRLLRHRHARARKGADQQQQGERMGQQSLQ